MIFKHCVCKNRTNLQRETSHCAGSNPNVPVICPLDLSWTSWTSWTICSANCGVSYRQRTRSCVNGQYGGPQCAVPYEEEQKACTVFENYPKKSHFNFLIFLGL